MDAQEKRGERGKDHRSALFQTKSNAADETDVHDLASDVGTKAVPPDDDDCDSLDSGDDYRMSRSASQVLALADVYRRRGMQIPDDLGIEMSTTTNLSGMPSAPEAPAQMEHDDVDDVEEQWHSLEQNKTRPHTSSFAGLQ